MMNFIISFSNTRQFNLKQENQEFYSQIIIKHAEDYCFSMTVSGMIFYSFFWLLLLWDFRVGPYIYNSREEMFQEKKP